MVQRFDGEAVGVEAEAADDTLAGCRDEGMVAELFTLMDIGDVHLDDGALQRADAVVESHRRMGIGSGIEHDAVVTEAHLLHLVDELALDIALVIVDGDVGILCPQLRQILVEGGRAVDARLTGAEEVQIGTIDDLDFHISKIFCNFAGKSTK